MSKPIEFRRIPGAPDYSVSENGDVMSLRRGMLLTLCNDRGYRTVRIWKDGKTKTCRVHRLVLEAFVGPCPAGHESRHLNSKKADNRVKNLMWATHAKNMADEPRRPFLDFDNSPWKR